MAKFISGVLLSGLIGILGLILSYQSWQIQKRQYEMQVANDKRTLEHQTKEIDSLQELNKGLSLLVASAEDRNAILQFVIDTWETNTLTPEEIAKFLEATEKSREKQLDLVVKLQTKAKELELSDVENTLEAVRKLLGNPHSSGISLVPQTGNSVVVPSRGRSTNPGQKNGVSGASIVPPELPPVPSDGPKGNLIICVPNQPNSYVRIYRLVHAGKTSRGETLLRWERWDKGKINYGSRMPNGLIKIDGIPVNDVVFGDEGEPYKIELYVQGKFKGAVGDVLAGQEPFLIMPNRDNYIKQWSAPCW